MQKSKVHQIKNKCCFQHKPSRERIEKENVHFDQSVEPIVPWTHTCFFESKTLTKIRGVSL